MLELARAGRSALLVAATGAGKTLAGFLPTICELAEQPGRGPAHALRLAAEGAGGRRPAQPHRPDRGDGAADPGRDPHRRHARPTARRGSGCKPPQVLLTTPESLSLLLSYPGRGADVRRGCGRSSSTSSTASPRRSAATCCRCRWRGCRSSRPGLRRVGLSATISDPDAYRSWLAPDADMELVDLVIGDPGAEPDLSILIPENKIPWGGHSGRHAVARGDGADRAAQDDARLLQHAQPRRADLPGPVGGQRPGAADRHPPRQPGGRGAAQGRGGDGRRAGCAGWSRPPASTSASTGATSTSSSRWARPRAARACCSGSAAPTTGSTSRARASSSPATASNISRRARRSTRSTTASSTPRSSAPARSTCSPSTSWRWRCAAPFQQDELLAEVRSAAPYAGLKHETFEEILNFIATGGYALKAYDRFRRLVPRAGRHVADRPAADRPAAPAQRRGHRRAAAAHRPLPQRPQARHDRGRLSPRRSRPATISSSPGLSLEVEQFKDTDIIVRASSKPARIVDLRRPAHVDVDPPRQPRPAHAAPTATTGPAFPTTSANGSRCSPSARSCPSRTSCWSRPSRTKASISWSPTASKAGTRTSRSAC